jgi:hypothetical protein
LVWCPPRGAPRPRQGSGALSEDGVMKVFRAFADGEKTSRSRSRRGTRDRRTPTGLIHAAAPRDSATLCGQDLLDLFEFGRSRFPYEHFPHDRRCPACNEAAGRPFE